MSGTLGIEGKIYVNFVVESDGSISTAKVVKGLDALLDAEAVRSVQALPKMIPATLTENRCESNILYPSMRT